MYKSTTVLYIALIHTSCRQWLKFVYEQYSRINCSVANSLQTSRDGTQLIRSSSE